MSESDILYAELLTNIRQISVIASLKSPITKETTLKLSQDGQSVILIHNGSTQKHNLPAPVAVSPHVLSHQSGKEISWRLPLRDQSSPKQDEDFSQAAIAPWAAVSLSESPSIHCRLCQSVLVESGSIETWKDLPSENWAEMMDFWHCHKPTEDEDGTPGHSHQEDDESSHQEGYGAHAPFLAEPGVGLVGLTYFLLSEKDCQNIVKPPPHNDAQSLTCQTCSNPLGTRDPQASGIRLHKWSLSLPPMPDYPLSHFLTAHIASLISAQATSKFVIHAPAAPAATAVHAWILAPRITYTLSRTERNDRGARVAMKIFYQTLPQGEGLAQLRDDAAVEEIALPPEAMGEVVEVLRASNGLLPGSVRRFRGWDVGVLDRYDGDGGKDSVSVGVGD